MVLRMRLRNGTVYPPTGGWRDRKAHLCVELAVGQPPRRQRHFKTNTAAVGGRREYAADVRGAAAEVVHRGG